MKKTGTFDELMKMAEEYGVADNALFISAAKQHAIQMKVIANIEAILGDGDLLVSKEYVKSRENVYSHPLVKDLPKNADSANRTLSVMLDIITKLGKKAEPSKSMEELMSE